MDHDIVLNMENVCPKRKIRTHVFCAVTASASRSETLWTVVWLGGVFVVFKHKHTPPESKQIEDQRSINKYSQMLFQFYYNSAKLYPVENAQIFKV